MNRRYRSTWERLQAQTEVPPDQLEGTGCWVWQGSCCCKGYGRFSLRLPGVKTPRAVRCHQWVMDQLDPGWREKAARRLHCEPKDVTLDHLCRETRCWNPDHLEPVTRAENSRRRYLPYYSA